MSVDLRGRRARSGARARGAGRLRTTVLVIAIVAAAVALRGELPRSPSHVRVVAIDNRTQYDLHLALGGFDSGGVVGLGIASQRCERTFSEVLDPGDAWTFHLSAQSHDGGAITVSRADLEASGWRVVIPLSVGDALAGAGAAAPPTRGCT